MLLAYALSLTVNSQGAAPVIPNGAFLHNPYLQIGNQVQVQSFLTLVWHTTTETAKWTVRYKSSMGFVEVPSQSKLISSAMVPFSSNSAELTDLVPGDSFAYSVLKDGNEVFSSTGKGPRYGAKRWRLNAFGDCGAGTEGQAGVAFHVAKSNPDLILSTGDTVYNTSTASEYEKNFWNYYNRNDSSQDKGAGLMRRIPWVAVAGNHDFRSTDLTKYPDGLAYFYYWSQPLNGPKLGVGNAMTPIAKGKNLDAFTKTAGDNYPTMANFSFEYGNAHFVILNSNPNVNWGDPAVRDWLENDLKNTRPDFWRIVSYHHPEFQSSKSHADNKWMRVLSDLFVKHKVDLVLNGHVHNYQRTKPILTSYKSFLKERLYMNDWPLDRKFDGDRQIETDGVVRIVTGAGGAGLYNPEIEAKPNEWLPFTEKYIVKHSFSQLDFEGDILRFAQIGSEGSRLDKFTLKRKVK
jgi:acid phosphatase type 7